MHLFSIMHTIELICIFAFGHMYKLVEVKFILSALFNDNCLIATDV